MRPWESEALGPLLLLGSLVGALDSVHEHLPRKRCWPRGCGFSVFHQAWDSPGPLLPLCRLVCCALGDQGLPCTDGRRGCALSAGLWQTGEWVRVSEAGSQGLEQKETPGAGGTGPAEFRSTVGDVSLQTCLGGPLTTEGVISADNSFAWGWATGHTSLRAGPQDSVWPGLRVRVQAGTSPYIGLPQATLPLRLDAPIRWGAEEAPPPRSRGPGFCALPTATCGQGA